FVLVVGTTEAPSPTTIELGVFAAKGLWCGSPHRSPRSIDALDWSAESSRPGGLPGHRRRFRQAPYSGRQPNALRLRQALRPFNNYVGFELIPFSSHHGLLPFDPDSHSTSLRQPPPRRGSVHPSLPHIPLKWIFVFPIRQATFSDVKRCEVLTAETRCSENPDNDQESLRKLRYGDSGCCVRR